MRIAVAEGKSCREKETDNTGAQTSNGRFDVIGNLELPENVLHPIKGLDIQYPASNQDKGEHNIGAQFQGVSKKKILRFKQGPPSEHQAKDTVSNDRRNAGRDDHFCFKLRLSVKDFGSK